MTIERAEQMTVTILIVCAVLLWIIARRLRRIVRVLETAKLEITIPIYGENPDPEPAAQPRRQDNVVEIRRRRA